MLKIKLFWNKCCTVHSVRNCFRIGSEMCHFSMTWPVDLHAWEKTHWNSVQMSKKKSLCSLCARGQEMPWIYLYCHLSLRARLAKLSETFTGEFSVRTSRLLIAINTVEFILTMNVCVKMLLKNKPPVPVPAEKLWSGELWWAVLQQHRRSSHKSKCKSDLMQRQSLQRCLRRHAL